MCDGYALRRVKVILPFHNESENLETVVCDVIDSLRSASYEPSILLVDDGSTDGSLNVVKQLCLSQDCIEFISFSRNFGKETALIAGLNEAGDSFDLLAYMDSDGQHSTQDLLRLLDAAQSDEVDLACGVRSDRTYQTSGQRVMARLFYRLFRTFGDAPIDEGAGDFNVLKPHVVNALRCLQEEHPFMKGLIGWIGFRKQLVPVGILDRQAGSAKSSTSKMLRLAFSAILSFSSWPLRAWSAIGMISALVAVTYLIFVVAQTILWGIDVPGYASTVILLLGFGGLQLLSIGIMGEYVARIYDASKKRPRYIIKDRS